MNERINELRLEAGISRLHEVPYIVAVNKAGEIEDPLVGLEKFAELIVRECANTVTDRCEMRGEGDVKRAEYHARRIKEHFGIEDK